eukprot:jgi/Orpsp1_1/1191652/evm.model.d7180000087575.1
MQDIISKIGPFSTLDLNQTVITKLITSNYFPWTCLVILLSRNNLKRTIILFLVFHYLFRTIGDMLIYVTFFVEKKDMTHFPYSNEAWLYGFGVASIFWFLSEIIGDWYLLIRTKVLIKNTKKLRWVIGTCLCYNMIKIIQIYNFLSYVPFTIGYDIKAPNYNNIYQLNLAKHKFNKWINVALQQICSLIYDITVIIALRKNVFNKLQGLKIKQSRNNFLTKFKQISEYRIYLSIIITMLGIPFIFGFCIKVIYLYTVNKDAIIKMDDKKLSYFINNTDDNAVENIREVILNFNYVFMYIDQILLRYFVEENNSTRKFTGTNASMNKNNATIGSSNTYKYKILYQNQNSRNYDDYDERNPFNYNAINNSNTLNSFTNSNYNTLK